jgi:hypothetical protein
MSNISKLTSNNQYFKSNYDSALKYVIPPFYFNEDNKGTQKELDILDKVINSNLNCINNFSSILDVSTLREPESIAPYFIKQNNLTDIDLNDFERKILVPLNISLKSFNSSSEFSDYIKDTLLPGITLNEPTLDFLEGGSVSANHRYLITNLSWMYFLNTGSPFNSYDPSNIVHDLIINKLYINQPVLINDGIKGFVNYIWKNYSVNPQWAGLGLLPEQFLPTVESTTYTSGTQQLEKLQTLIDIVYSPLSIDNADTRVKNAIDDFLTTGDLITGASNYGPFSRLIKAFSMAFADYQNNIDRLGVINDLNRCEDSHLPRIAELIGWKLFGSEPDRWRLQLANAVDIYRTTGTKKSIQFAVDSVFGQEVFDISSTVLEQWESYIPNLIYYSLATESTLLKDYSTFTRDVANSLGIDNYSLDNFDHNIRSCTDKILQDVVYQFSSNFYLGVDKFPLESEDFVFNYRNKDHKIPPFEQYPYYTQSVITKSMIDFIADKLVCYFVPQDFAIKVRDYMLTNLFSIEDVAIKNGFLFFTSATQYPPNWDSIIKDITNTKSEYLPLWNNKSSHFKVILDASGFDFNKNSLESDTRETLKIAAQIAGEFSPAHSIPHVLAKISDEDNYSNSHSNNNYVSFNKTDHGALLTASSNIMSTYGASALAMSSYKRGFTATSVATFSRGSVDSLVDPLVAPGGTVAILPRRSHRRRNLKNIVPTEGFYDRTGFNMPTPIANYTTAINNFLPLGFIPSSLQYVPIPNYNELPAIYGICENLNSPNVYNEVVVSNTYPVRGWQTSSTLERGTLNSFLATLHSIRERVKTQEASAYYYANPDFYRDNKDWLNVIENYANSSTEYSGNFPETFDDYLNFEFGKEFHKYYREYCHTFQQHNLFPNILNMHGPNIFSHTFGPLIANVNNQSNSPDIFITSSLSDFKNINYGENLFSLSGLTSGCYLASSILNYGTGINELRSSSLISEVELCQTSGSSRRNSFSVIKLDKQNKSEDFINKFIYDNVFIKQVSTDGFGRIIFNISKYPWKDSLYSVNNFSPQYNFLTPEHEFSFNFKCLVTDPNARILGGASIGVWIHTEVEDGKVWSFTKDKTWIQHSASGINKNQVINKYCINTLLANSQRTDEIIQGQTTQCLRYLIPSNPNRENDAINSFLESEFTNIKIHFNTINDPSIVPEDYFYKVSNNIHRLDQKYVVEVFMLPVQDDKYSLFTGFNIQDLTLKQMSEIFVSGVGNGANYGDIYSKEFKVSLEKQEIFNIFKYFNDIRGVYHNAGLASREASKTQAYYETSGGSRINYVENPDWSAYTLNSFYQIKTSFTFTN